MMRRDGFLHSALDPRALNIRFIERDTTMDISCTHLLRETFYKIFLQNSFLEEIIIERRHV